jgi:hypothetical protein
MITSHVHAISQPRQHPRDDYLRALDTVFLTLSSYLVGMTSEATIYKPGDMHRARWMSKAIYSLKMELLYEGNEAVLKLTSRELQAIKRFNRFVVGVYIESWFTSKSAVDAPVNDIRLIEKLIAFDDDLVSKL